MCCVLIVETDADKLSQLLRRIKETGRITLIYTALGISSKSVGNHTTNCHAVGRHIKTSGPFPWA